MVTKQVQEALNILGLNLMFSVEELKKSYRKNANEWHPDHGKDPSGEKMKAINSAYELLTDFLKDKEKYIVRPRATTTSQGQGRTQTNRRRRPESPFDLHKKQAVLILEGYIDYISKFTNHELYNYIRVYGLNVKNIVNRYKNRIYNCINEAELIMVYDEAILELDSQLEIIYDGFIKTYPYLKEINFVPNYKLSLSMFIKQLDDLLKGLKNRLYNNLMYKVNEMYRSNVTYNELKDVVSDKAAEVIESILRKPGNKEEQLDNFFNEVRDMFRKSFELYKRQNIFNQLESSVVNVGSLLLKQRLESLKGNIENEYFYDEIEYIKKEVKAIENGTYILQVRKYLLEKYAEVSADRKNMTRISEISRLLGNVLKVLDRSKDGFISYDVVAFLYTVNFDDLEQDSRIIDYVANKYGVPNIGYAYMPNTEYPSITSFANLELDEEGYTLKYKGTYGMGILHPETAADLSQDFISVTSFLAKASFVGKKGVTALGTNLYILYEYNGKAIAMNDKGNLSSINMDRIVRLEDRRYRVVDIYEDKKKLSDKIAFTIRDTYQEERKTRGK